MQAYFSRVIAAEKEVFGSVRFRPVQCANMSLKAGDLNALDIGLLAPALKSDVYVVFGASYIKGPLVEFLVTHRAINIHMGVSPYYRGTSCNFWAVFDGNPDLVGATIHLLSRGLDSGNMLFHALPQPVPCDPFLLGMRAGRTAHTSLVEEIAAGTILSHLPVAQDRSRKFATPATATSRTMLQASIWPATWTARLSANCSRSPRPESCCAQDTVSQEAPARYIVSSTRREAVPLLDTTPILDKKGRSSRKQFFRHAVITD